MTGRWIASVARAVIRPHTYERTVAAALADVQHERTKPEYGWLRAYRGVVARSRAGSLPSFVARCLPALLIPVAVVLTRRLESATRPVLVSALLVANIFAIVWGVDAADRDRDADVRAGALPR